MIAAALLLLVIGDPVLVFEGKQGPGNGRHIVFLAGDEEYRSEEGLPQLAKILAERHGFKCTVLFSLNASGEIDPTVQDHQPGIEALDSADLCVMLLRFRHWPDYQMKHFVDYYLAGKPILALRTSTHAFSYPVDSSSPYRKFGWQSREWPGGFGKQVLGENWVSHWGNHGGQATRGVVDERIGKHPILKGVKSVFGTSDVYEASPPPDAKILMRGEVVAGMKPADPTAMGRKKTVAGVDQELNNPMMPIAWIREIKNEEGKKNRILTSTMGAATDLENEGLRRLLVNGAYWAIGMEGRIPVRSEVGLIGGYKPSPFGFGGYRKGVRPLDLKGMPVP